jgi:hypothetical protein
VLKDRVICPSVYSTSSWVLRLLSIKELAAIYHLPTVLHKQVDMRYEFTLAAPGLLLKYVWENVVHSLPSRPQGLVVERRRSRGSGGQHLAKEKISKLASNCTDLEPEGVLVQRDERTSVPPTINTGPATGTFDFSIAVKADNAETPAFIWDDRVWG